MTRDNILKESVLLAACRENTSRDFFVFSRDSIWVVGVSEPVRNRVGNQSNI